MSSSTGSNVDATAQLHWFNCSSSNNSGGCARWSAANIVGMVIGFMIFWPLGLAILAWILSGRQVRDLPAATRDLWARFFSNGEARFHKGTDNIVFNEYQQTQHDRISEIKNEIRERARRFSEFREDIQRRRDQEEFERFMASAPSNSGRTE